MFKIQKQYDTHNSIMQANGKVKEIYADLDMSEQELMESFSNTRKKNANYQIK